jgi:enoyl-[acyl-carrier protein] reductase I
MGPPCGEQLLPLTSRELIMWADRLAGRWESPMGLMDGKKGLIFGVANDRSLAWHIAERLHAEGAVLGFTHLPPPKMERRVRLLAEPIEAPVILPCDVTDDDQIEHVFRETHRLMGEVDLVVHSIAYASRASLSEPFYKTTRADFLQAMEISAYSLIALAQHGLPYMAEGASMLTLSYLGGVRMIPGYNVMGVCKAALESAVRYLAGELGREKNIRVNAISAGPVQTLSAAGVSGFDKVLRHYPQKSPLHRNIRPPEVGSAGLYLLSELSSGVTGEVHYVDAGYNIVGW